MSKGWWIVVILSFGTLLWGGILLIKEYFDEQKKAAESGKHEAELERLADIEEEKFMTEFRKEMMARPLEERLQDAFKEYQRRTQNAKDDEQKKEIGESVNELFVTNINFSEKQLKVPDEFVWQKGKQGPIVGVNKYFGLEQKVYVPDDLRIQHAYIVGKTRQGKSVLMANMIIQDIQNGNGVAVIDPHGALIKEWILPRIPKERMDDVIIFDPADEEYPIGFNMFQAETKLEKRLVKNDIVVAFRRLFHGSSWGDNIATIIRTTVDTLLADTSRIYSLLDVANMINDEGFRFEVLERIRDPFGSLKDFWIDLYPTYQPSTIGALKRRLFDILGDPLIGEILGQRETTFNIREAMDNKKIFLASLAKGVLGEHISNVFGGLLVSKIQLTSLARAAQKTEDLTPFYLYVDEFQNFTNESFNEILSESSKYQLFLTLAHQFASQLPTVIRDAIIGNVGTYFVFNSSHKDGGAIAGELSNEVTADDIVKLPRFNTFTRMGTAANTFTMSTVLPSEPTEAHAKPQEVIESSRAKYCWEKEATQIAETEEEQGDDDFVI